MGRAEPHPCCLCSRHASAADSPIAVLARLGRAVRLAPQVPGRLWRGSLPAVFPRCMACSGLWTPDGPHVVRNTGKMVDAYSLCVYGPAGCVHLFWNMEGSRRTKGRSGEKTCIEGNRQLASVELQGKSNVDRKFIGRCSQKIKAQSGIELPEPTAPVFGRRDSFALTNIGMLSRRSTASSAMSYAPGSSLASCDASFAFSQAFSTLPFTC